MSQKKKLQVFVSSTYEDLKEERQAAVEAILTAGHIPAGMELFAAGDESQMNAIRRWINESDVYLLILGGRYGSIEPKSQKSYIHLEYEFAIERGKPFFAVVIRDDYLEEKVKKEGRRVIETENPQKLKEFRAQVLTKLVRFWSEARDIKLAILETMSEFSRHDDLVGWIPGDEGIKASTLTEEIARLAKENTSLREQMAKASESLRYESYNGLTFEQVCNELASDFFDEELRDKGMIPVLHKRAHVPMDERLTLLQCFLVYGEDLVSGTEIPDQLYRSLALIGLIRNDVTRPYGILTDLGKRFMLHLRNRNINQK
ncbi:MAG: DUF4062 domain-containing protein [Chloroflexi bacterium]|nr:DUF4062 domain-containing protein [Chloroflexota bacterium]